MVNDQLPPVIYDEALVPEYTLPDVRRNAEGAAVTSADQWPSQRAYLRHRFETHVYGTLPPAGQVKATLDESSEQALGGQAVRQQISLEIAPGHTVRLLVYRPRTTGSVPVFLGLNFRGNHTIQPDPDIYLPSGWVPADTGAVENRATDVGRGAKASRWPVERIVARGYAVATIYCGDISPDKDDQFRDSVHTRFYQTGQTMPAATEWGTLGAWAWGLSRALDYLETDSAFGPVAVVGHSRLGKAALWAGATDTRFALTISNNSGCGGAALFRRCFGETIAAINRLAPYWFCQNFHQYDHREADLPVDQHMLLALIAPRPLYIASASEDLWADPRGEFLSAVHASPVYELLGKPGLPVHEFPAPDQPITGGTIGYHLRTGPHDLTAYDWDRYMDFADQHLR